MDPVDLVSSVIYSILERLFRLLAENYLTVFCLFVDMMYIASLVSYYSVGVCCYWRHISHFLFRITFASLKILVEWNWTYNVSHWSIPSLLFPIPDFFFLMWIKWLFSFNYFSSQFNRSASHCELHSIKVSK